MKMFTRILIAAWALEAAGIAYALAVPVGEASAWVLFPTALIGLPLLAHFAVVALRPLEASTEAPSHHVTVDGVEYAPKAEAVTSAETS